MPEIVKRPGLFRQLYRRKTRGLALFDVILAVGIVGFLIAGAVVLLQAANERIKRNDTASAINQIRAEASRIYAGRPSYEGLDMNRLRIRGSLPDYVIRDDGSGGIKYEHPYDGEIAVSPIAGSKRMTISLANLDDGACADLLGAWAGKTRQGSGIMAVGVAKAGRLNKTFSLRGNGWRLDGGAQKESGATGFKETDIDDLCDEGVAENDVYLLFQG